MKIQLDYVIQLIFTFLPSVAFFNDFFFSTSIFDVGHWTKSGCSKQFWLIVQVDKNESFNLLMQVKNLFPSRILACNKKIGWQNDWFNK
jgi:hypothetical protein